MSGTAGLEYRGLARARGGLAFLSGGTRLTYREHVEIFGPDGAARAGRVLAISEDAAVVEVFGGTDGLDLESCRVRCSGGPMRVPVGEEILGRVFDGLGRPRDGLPAPLAEEERPIDGAPINPCRREYPRNFLETGVSAIDGLNSLVLGQKLPIFTESGLSHDALAMQIVEQARAPSVERFVVVFAALGLPRELALRYQEFFRSSGALGRLVAYFNFADDAPAERLIAPRCALTAAEFLAFDRGYHVLVILHDVTNYGEALREASSASGEIPSRKGYPGYLYSDLASLFERAGRIRGRPGSVTQLPIVTMPNGDMTHPIPDLTGYVTEGQIVLDRDLHRRGIYPPVSVLASLSRLMPDGIGPGRTRDDHEEVSRRLYAACARAARARDLAAIIGREELSPAERSALSFADGFERRFLAQGRRERRSIAETLDRGRDALAILAAADEERSEASG